ncbi:MAG: hypothetical protein ABFC94_02675 [Syntrophomonas sp.]
MENHIKQGIIIEFFGLPGSGKTTLANMFADKLEQSGYSIQKSIYRINNECNTIARLLIKTYTTLCFTLNNFPFIYNLFSFIYEEKNIFRNLKDIIKQWINICFVLNYINKGNETDIVIADQGVIQAAISISFYHKNIDLNSIIKRLISQISKNQVFIYVHVDIEKDLKRLKNRKNGKSRLEKENNTIIKTMQLQKIESQCNTIANSFKCIVIDNNESYSAELSTTNNINTIISNLVQEVITKYLLRLEDISSL